MLTSRTYLTAYTYSLLDPSQMFRGIHGNYRPRYATVLTYKGERTQKLTDLCFGSDGFPDSTSYWEGDSSF